MSQAGNFLASDLRFHAPRRACSPAPGEHLAGAPGFPPTAVFYTGKPCEATLLNTMLHHI